MAGLTFTALTILVAFLSCLSIDVHAAPHNIERSYELPSCPCNGPSLKLSPTGYEPSQWHEKEEGPSETSSVYEEKHPQETCTEAEGHSPEHTPCPTSNGHLWWPQTTWSPEGGSISAFPTYNKGIGYYTAPTEVTAASAVETWSTVQESIYFTIPKYPTLTTAPWGYPTTKSEAEETPTTNGEHSYTTPPPYPTKVVAASATEKGGESGPCTTTTPCETGKETEPSYPGETSKPGHGYPPPESETYSTQAAEPTGYGTKNWGRSLSSLSGLSSPQKRGDTPSGGEEHCKYCTDEDETCTYCGKGLDKKYVDGTLLERNEPAPYEPENPCEEYREYDERCCGSDGHGHHDKHKRFVNSRSPGIRRGHQARDILAY